MPIKFKETSTTILKGGKKIVQHHFMKDQLTGVLSEELSKCVETNQHGVEVTKKGKGKLKQKIHNELVRRGIKS